MTQAAACACCDKQDCSTVVIIPAVPERSKNFDHQKRRLEMICPACHRIFSVPFGKVEYRDVTDEELTQGFLDRAIH